MSDSLERLCEAAQKRWESDEIQFPRLLSEIGAMGLTHKQYAELCESMDLELEDVDALFDRADAAWERHKREVFKDLPFGQ